MVRVPDQGSKEGITVQLPGDPRQAVIQAGEYAELSDGRLAVCSTSLPAWLLQGSEGDAGGRHDRVQSYLTATTVGLSIDCLAVAFAVHCICPALRTIPGYI